MKTLVTSKMCMTKDIGAHGNLFGGNMLAWMDEAAAIYAMQSIGNKNVVSVRFSEIVFKIPVKQEDIISFYCRNPRRGTTSLTFDVIAEVSGHTVFQTECTFVAVNNEGRKTVIDWSRTPLGESQ